MGRLALDDGTLCYDVIGEGIPMVFLHGGWMNREVWGPQVDHFAGTHRVITVDIRGHGRTGATGRRRYSVDLFVDDLERLLFHLDLDRPILCGLSLGSMVVQAFLDRHPERARGAILGGPVRSMPPITLPAGVKPLFSPLPAIDTSLRTVGPTGTFQSLLGWIRATTGGPWLTVDPSVRSRMMEGVGEISRSEFMKIFAALYRFDPPDLSGTPTPTLVIYGDREAIPVKRQGRAIATAVEDGRWIAVPDAAHLVNQDNPETFNAAGAEFVADCVS